MATSLFANMLVVFTISGIIGHSIKGTYISMFILLTYSSFIQLIYNTLCIFDTYIDAPITKYFGKTAELLFEIWDQQMELLGRRMVIMDREGNEPYLIRYYMLFVDRNDNGGFPFNIFIHKFIIGDDADKHDHPWNFFTLILSGGYYEEYEKIVEGRKITLTEFRYPGFFQYVKSTHTHRVILPENKGCWTLFIPFKKNREWGFWRTISNTSEIGEKKKEWVPAKQYLKDKKNLHKTY